MVKLREETRQPSSLLSGFPLTLVDEFFLSLLMMQEERMTAKTGLIHGTREISNATDCVSVSASSRQTGSAAMFEPLKHCRLVAQRLKRHRWHAEDLLG